MFVCRNVGEAGNAARRWITVALVRQDFSHENPKVWSGAAAGLTLLAFLLLLLLLARFGTIEI